MSDSWAYFNKGSNHYQSQWDWSQPHDMLERGHSKSSAFFEATRAHIRSANVQYKTDAPQINWPEKDGRHFIAFDGERWRFGYGGLPNSFLDSEKYPKHIYSYEGFGGYKPGNSNRPTKWLHGYISHNAGFPESIPHMDKAAVARLHEEHIIPHWFRDGDEVGHIKIPPTAYSPLKDMPHVRLEQYLPESAIASLKNAHAQGKPIMLAYDESTKTVEDVSGLYSQKLRHAEYQRKLQTPAAGSSNSSTIPSVSSSSNASTTSSRATERMSEGLVSKFKGMNTGGKVVVVGGSVALAAVLGYWVYNALHRKNADKKQQAAVSR